MQLSKSYQLLRYLNREHNIFQRNTLSVLGWLGTLSCTGSPTLARGIARDFHQDRFDLAFRKSARYARLFWAKLELFHIPFFDFTQNTSSAERKIMARRIRKMSLNARTTDQNTDLLYILASEIHYSIAQNIPADDLIHEFNQAANFVLSNLPESIEADKKAASASSNDFAKQDAVLALQDIAKILPLNEWPWFIMSGTFLGQHREGGFLSHDYDIDLGIHAEDINIDELLALLQKQTIFMVQKTDDSIEVIRSNQGLPALSIKTSIVKLIHTNGIPVDLFIHYTENGICWHGSVLHRWENKPFGLTQTIMEGVTVNSPDNADQYLTENYGDWKTPVTEFDCTTGTPNLTFTRNYTSLALCLKRLAYFSEFDSRQAKKLLNTLIYTDCIAQNLDTKGKIQLSMKIVL